jgi:subtilase family serine protease
MGSGVRLSAALVAAALISLPAAPGAVRQDGRPESRPDFDIRDGRPAAPVRETGELPAGTTRGARAQRTIRLVRETGAVRVLDDPGLSAPRAAAPNAIRALLVSNARRLGLAPTDLTTLSAVRDYTSRSTGVRHVVFAQIVDGRPVFDSAVTVHVDRDGNVLRITSNAAPIDGRDATAIVAGEAARAEALTHAGGGAIEAASLTWLPLEGGLRLAWHVTVQANEAGDVYDILIDARSAELLVRRNRARRVNGSGRILQSANAPDPRFPDPMPFGADGTLACPPPVNHSLRSLNAPFRDPGSVLAGTGKLEGNNAKLFRGSTSGSAATGSFDGSQWLFDFPFNSAGAAETYLFFAMNYVHDFFYDLGFDEAAGNFQLDNFGRGGLGGDPVKAVARASGRNNANYVHATDGSSPTINMFLWDGNGCWAQDVDNDGTTDLDGDLDLDIIVHEFHHGVSLRLNTSWTGNEAGAIGEGGGDFFAYSVNGNTQLAEYARPGGLRTVNGKGYADWTCLLGIFCEVHDNGEIWANVLWDVRERFRVDLVRGSETAAINESHQVYVDGLTLSPPAPTMLDMRDAMLQADALRNPGGPTSQNYCRLWESFAERGMGVSATDTSDNGFNAVGAAYDVPSGCAAPPAPPLVTVAATTSSAYEAGTVPGVVTITRGGSTDRTITVNLLVGGSATTGSDYVAVPGSVTIPAGATSATVQVLPIDDQAIENNETVVLTLYAGSGYTVGAPSSATVTIVSNDVASDLVVTALTGPRTAAAGATIQVSDTTKNQGTGTAAPSTTSFYLSANSLLDAADPLLGNRAVPELAVGASNSGNSSLVLPNPLAAGTYYLFAKADGPGSLGETNELNNWRTITVLVGPDLAVTTLTGPSIAAAGGSLVVSETTANQGAGDAAASTTRFYLSSNFSIDAADPVVQTRNVPALAAGASSSASTTIPIPANTATGVYYLIAQADGTAAIPEPNESNNTRFILVSVGPDLQIYTWSVPTRAAPGGAISVTETTRNMGAGLAGPSVTGFYLSSNYILDAGDTRLLPGRQVPALGPNESSTGTTSLTLPNVAPGTWYLLLRADDQGAVVETQEPNNVRFSTIQVGPDLSFSIVLASSTATAGGTVSVSATIRNGGGAPAGASVIGFYLSTNSVLDAGDQLLNAQRAVPALGVDQVNSGTTTVPLPAGMTGTYYILAVADVTQAVAESNELNNVGARQVVISGGN